LSQSRTIVDVSGKDRRCAVKIRISEDSRAKVVVGDGDISAWIAVKVVVIVYGVIAAHQKIVVDGHAVDWTELVIDHNRISLVVLVNYRIVLDID